MIEYEMTKGLLRMDYEYIFFSSIYFSLLEKIDFLICIRFFYYGRVVEEQLFSKEQLISINFDNYRHKDDQYYSEKCYSGIHGRHIYFEEIGFRFDEVKSYILFDNNKDLAMFKLRVPPDYI